jgi:hypothetical protein
MTNELSHLIAEIDSRLVDCSSLVSPCSSRVASRVSTRIHKPDGDKSPEPGSSNAK